MLCMTMHFCDTYSSHDIFFCICSVQALDRRFQLQEAMSKGAPIFCHWVLPIQTQLGSEEQNMTLERCPIWKNLGKWFFMCCSNAASVGGIASICFPFCANRSSLASSTVWALLVQSYITTTNLCTTGMNTSNWCACAGSIIIPKASVRSLYAVQVSHADFLPFPKKMWTHGTTIIWKLSLD